MSYATRRNGTNTRSNAPQVNYHQAPPGAQRQSGRVAAQQQNAGYCSPAPAVGANTYQTYTTQTGYSTVQQPPPPPPQQAVKQSQPPLPAAQTLAQQPPLPVSPAVGREQKLPLIKVLPPTPAKPDAAPQPKADQGASVVADKPIKMDEEHDDDESVADTNGEEKRKKRFWSSRYNSATYKVNKKMRRKRQNARLRKILMPKNALMIIHELYPDMKATVQEQFNALNQTVFSTVVSVENKTYHGQALSKTGSKLIACENALKSILLEKMGKAARKQIPGMEGIDAMETKVEVLDAEPVEGGENGGGDEEMDCSGGVGQAKEPLGRPDDDVPWRSLASFAMHKLFVEWQNQGIQVPMVPAFTHSFGGSAAGTSTAAPPPPPPSQPNSSMDSSGNAASNMASPRPMKKLPDNPNNCHPVQLLNQLRPGSLYTEQCGGNMPNLTYSVTVNIDGQDYVGVAGNKKEAKRQCARAALINMGIMTDN